MQALNLEVAGEFLVMASTLVHIKSKSLLPRHGDEEEEEDPEVMRQELSRRLIEYERFKEAAARLGDRPVLGRDVFVRDFLGEEIPGEELVITELSMADLITAFKDALSRMPADAAHGVLRRADHHRRRHRLPPRPPEGGRLHPVRGHRRALHSRGTRSYPFSWASSSWSASRRFACTRRTRWG